MDDDTGEYYTVGEALDHIGEPGAIRRIRICLVCLTPGCMRRGLANCVVVRAGFGSFHVLMLFYCGCAWAADATEMMLLSFLGPAVCTTSA